MKKTLLSAIGSVLLMAGVGLPLSACSSDDEQTPVNAANDTSQQGYWSKSDFIALTPDDASTVRYVQAMDDESRKMLNDLYDVMEDKEGGPLWRLDNGRYFASIDYHLPTGVFYESIIYKTTNGELVVVLPRIVVSLKEGSRIEDVLAHLGNDFVVESGEDDRYILSCQAKASSEVLDDVRRIHDYVTRYGGIKYFEPEMYLPIYIDQ